VVLARSTLLRATEQDPRYDRETQRSCSHGHLSLREEGWALYERRNESNTQGIWERNHLGMLASPVKYLYLRQSSMLGEAMRCMRQCLDGLPPLKQDRYNTVSIRGSVEVWKSGWE
jgi:hypothetical protein